MINFEAITGVKASNDSLVVSILDQIVPLLDDPDSLLRFNEA